MLNLSLVCIGRAKAGAERELAARYLDRARLAGRALGLAVDLWEIAESHARRAADRKAEEAVAIRAAVAGKATAFIVFDETGRSVDSESFSRLIKSAIEDGTSGLALVIGGPDGLDPGLRDSAAQVLALGTMTWPHQLVRVMVAEQIYRAITILSGHPYHRA